MRVRCSNLVVPLPALLPVLLAALCIGGCSAPPVRQARIPVSVDRPRPPADLSIAVTAFYPRAEADDAAPDPLERARFVIEPGGQLRAATGVATGIDHLPPRTRRLTEPQVLDVYTRILRGGLTVPGAGVDQSPARTALGGPVRPDPDRSLVVVEVIAHDHRTVAVHDTETSPAAADLVDRLRALARLRR